MLAAFSAITVATIFALESQITEKDNEISSLNSQLSSLQTVILRYMFFLNNSNNEIAYKDSQIAMLNSQISTLNNIVSLNVSTILIEKTVTQEAGEGTTIWNDALQFAGYIKADIQSSSNTTYVEVSYSSYGVNYHGVARVGNGTASFPILPALVTIKVGNSESEGYVTTTISVTYYY